MVVGMRKVVRALLLLVTLLALPPGTSEARPWSWLGVRIRDLSEQEMEEISARHGIREGFGVVIVEVIADTPAAQAGMKSGDIVVAFGERPVVETRLLQRLIASAPLDRESNLTVLRPEGRRALKVRLTSMPPTIAGERVAAEFGFSLREPLPPSESGRPRPATEPEAARAATGAPTVGVVARGSAAEKGGLEVGDVIVEVGDRAVLDADTARTTLAEREPNRPLPLTVRRGDRRLSLTLTP
jgi:serine protease Do